MRPDLRGRWRDAVFATSLVPPVVKVTLLAFADKMSANGTVSVPRDEIAQRIGKHPRKVTEHVAAAIQAGLLDRVSRGYEGHTAVFKAVMPDGQRVPKTSTLSMPEIGTLSAKKAQDEGAGNRHPISKGDSTVGRVQEGIFDPEEQKRGDEQTTITARVHATLPALGASIDASVRVPGEPLCRDCGQPAVFGDQCFGCWNWDQREIRRSSHPVLDDASYNF